MTNEDSKKNATKWRQWVAPVVVSACVFAVLTAASTISTSSSIIVAVAIIAAGLWLLRISEK